MSSAGTRPDLDGDERAQLVGWLDLQRGIVRWKCEGLSDEDAHRPVIPSSPTMTIAGLLKHLRWTEHCWFEVFFLNAPSTGNPQFQDEPEDGDWLTDAPLSQLLADYEQQCQKSNAIVSAHQLDELGRNPQYSPSLRWILAHMLEETARHAGHADLVRELLDGSTGYF